MSLSLTDGLHKLYLPTHAAFDVPQLRELVFAYTKSPENIPRGRSELLDLIDTYSSDRDFVKLLAKLETIQPYRHTFLFAFEGSQSVKELEARLLAWFAKNGHAELGSTKLTYLDYRAEAYLSIRFAHVVTSFVYESTGPTTQELKQKDQRHAVVVAIKPDLGVLEIRFEGFEQSKDTPPQLKVSYAAIASDCQTHLEAVLDISIRSLALKASIKEMLAKYPEEVAQSKNNSRIGVGRIAIDTGDDDEGDLNVFFQNAFASKDPIDPLVSMDNWTTESVVLRWKELKITTRIDLAAVTPEIFFSWKRGADKSVKNSDLIIRRLAEYTDLAFANSRQRIASRYLAMLAADEVFTPLDLAQASNAPLDASLGYLMEKVSKGEVALKFRVASHELLRDFSNKWYSSLAELPEIVVTESGHAIALQDPKNIEIGFSVKGVTK